MHVRHSLTRIFTILTKYLVAMAINLLQLMLDLPSSHKEINCFDFGQVLELDYLPLGTD